MKNFKRLALLAVYVMAVALTASPAAAHDPATETFIETEGPMTFTMKAWVTAPSQNAVFQANQDGTLPIDYASRGWASITPDGTQTETSNWKIQLTLSLISQGAPLDFRDSAAENITLSIAPGQTEAVKWGDSLAKAGHVTGTGGKTALHETRVADIEGVYQIHGHEHAHSFTVNAP